MLSPDERSTAYPSRILHSTGSAIAAQSVHDRGRPIPPMSDEWSRALVESPGLFFVAGAGLPSPHVEHCAGFIRHPARIPRRIPHDVDLDLADARHAGDRVLHHDRQL